jgi:site-specific DNA recombinase
MNQLAAVYARVTIDSQVAEVEKYAREKGYRLSPEYYFLDRAVSGAQLARPALDRLRDLAPEGIFETVLCLSPDRLSRQYAHQWILIEDLKKAGVQVVFVNQPAVADNPQGQLLLGIQGLFSEYERAMITDRLRRGKLYRVRQGDLVHTTAPYGYRYIPVSEPGGGCWVEYPVESEVVRHIYTLYTETNLRIEQIVDKLRENNAQLPARGQHWAYSTVQAILNQPAYTGTTYYNRTQSCHDRVGQPKKRGRGLNRTVVRLVRPKDEWITVNVPPLVAPEMWQKAQERLVINRKFSPRNNTLHFYLLRSLLVCQVCGRTLIGRNVNGMIAYYCTNGGKHRLADIPAHSCYISGKVIEPLVWQAVTQLLQNPDLLADGWKSEMQVSQTTPEEQDRLQARLKTLERQWQRLLDLFQDGTIQKAELSKRKEQLEHEQQAIQTRLQQFKRLAQQDQIKQTLLTDFSAFCQQVNANLENPSPQLQQDVIRLLVDHVVVGNDEIVIKHIVPTDDNCRLIPAYNYSQLFTVF